VTWSLLGTLDDLITYLLTWTEAGADTYSWARTEKYTCDITWQKSTANLHGCKEATGGSSQFSSSSSSGVKGETLKC